MHVTEKPDERCEFRREYEPAQQLTIIVNGKIIRVEDDGARIVRLGRNRT